jgi:hypothetical protein
MARANAGLNITADWKVLVNTLTAPADVEEYNQNEILQEAFMPQVRLTGSANLSLCELRYILLFPWHSF